MQVLVFAAATMAFGLTGHSHNAPSAVLRASRSFMVVDEANKPPPDVPEVAVSWGCDEETWKAIKNKRGLIKLCNAGEEDHFKSRLAKMKVLIANAPPPSPTAEPAKKTRKATKAEVLFKQRKEGPYEPFGTIPDDVDAISITARVNQRAAAKEAKDYALADSIREELAAMNIRIRDDFRTWAYKVARE